MPKRMTIVSGRISAHDVIEELVKHGILTDRQGVDLIDMAADRKLSLDVDVDASEIVDEADTAVLIAELEGRDDYDRTMECDARHLVEGVAYLRAGEGALAEAMFARELPDHVMATVGPACRGWQ